jgi:hypothetical protein
VFFFLLQTYLAVIFVFVVVLVVCICKCFVTLFIVVSFVF